jgi:hypothetical protein
MLRVCCGLPIKVSCILCRWHPHRPDRPLACNEQVALQPHRFNNKCFRGLTISCQYNEEVQCGSTVFFPTWRRRASP